MNIKKWMTYHEAHVFARSLVVKTSMEYKLWAQTKERPTNLPYNPSVIYKSKGWTNWFDFLGISKEEHRKRWNFNKRQYTIDENYFKRWSHNVAYILGLWWADGCMVNKYRLNIVLHKNDKYLLEQIQRKMTINKPLYRTQRNAYVLDMASTEVVKDVALLGGKPKKSKNMSLPIDLPIKFIPDFIRGLWDGDGGMWFSKNKAGCIGSLGSIASGDKKFLQNIAQLLGQNVPCIKTSIIDVHYYNHDNKKSYLNYALRFSTNNLRRLRDFMYLNNPELKMLRKYDMLKKLGPIKYMYPFEKGRSIARYLKISTAKKWQNYVDKNPSCHLPVRPDRVYKNKGWANWKNWLST